MLNKAPHIKRFEVLNKKEELEKLCAQLDERGEAFAFTPYRAELLAQVRGAPFYTPNAFITVAYGESDEILGVRTGFIYFKDGIAIIGWIVRRQADAYKDLRIGDGLIQASHDFLRKIGVNSVFTTGGTSHGQDLIKRNGGEALLNEDSNDPTNKYVFHLTEKSRTKLAAK